MLDLLSYFRFIAALGLVLALIGGTAWLLKRYGFERTPKRKKQQGRRLQILETRAIDTRHRLVLLSRDEVEHLVILGPHGESVIESGIKGNSQQLPQSLEDHKPSASQADERGGDLVELYKEGQNRAQQGGEG